MANIRCQACGTAVMPQAMYCSSCGQLIQRRPPHWLRRSVDAVLFGIRVLLLLWVSMLIGRATIPVALAISPVCATTDHTIALIPRSVGVIDSQYGLVGAQDFLQVGDCNQISAAWYRITTNQDIWFAAAQRDPQTWAGWLIVQGETVLGGVVSTSVQWVRRGIDFVAHVVAQ